MSHTTCIYFFDKDPNKSGFYAQKYKGHKGFWISVIRDIDGMVLREVEPSTARERNFIPVKSGHDTLYSNTTIRVETPTESVGELSADITLTFKSNPPIKSGYYWRKFSGKNNWSFYIERLIVVDGKPWTWHHDKLLLRVDKKRADNGEWCHENIDLVEMENTPPPPTRSTDDLCGQKETLFYKFKHIFTQRP